MNPNLKIMPATSITKDGVYWSAKRGSDQWQLCEANVHRGGRVSLDTHYDDDLWNVVVVGPLDLDLEKFPIPKAVIELTPPALAPVSAPALAPAEVPALHVMPLGAQRVSSLVLRAAQQRPYHIVSTEVRINPTYRV